MKTKSPSTVKFINLVTILRLGCLMGEVFGVVALLALITLLPFSYTLITEHGARFSVDTGINRSLKPGFAVSFSDRARGQVAMGSNEAAGGRKFPGSVSFGPLRLTGEAATRSDGADKSDPDVLVDNVDARVVFTDPMKAARALAYVKWPIALGILCANLSAIAVLELFRRMLRSAEKGDVFTEDNIRNVRSLGILIIASSAVKILTAGLLVRELASYLTRSLAPGKLALGTSVDGSMAGVITGLMILVLAKVFRHGLALQQESALTI